MSNGYVSNEMNAGRISAHGKITDLSAGFKHTSLVPFAILVVPKADVTAGVISNTDTNIGLIVSLRTHQGAAAANMPVYFHRWTEAAIRELAVNAIDLTTYDVYWGSGQTITPAS